MPFCEAPKTILMSVNFFSTLIVVATKDLKALLIPLITPTLAPNAITRALEASIDFVNSSASALILPSILPNGATAPDDLPKLLNAVAASPSIDLASVPFFATTGTSIALAMGPIILICNYT